MTIILTILFLIILGIILLFIEFAVIPGITLAGIGGVVLFILSIFLSFKTYGLATGILVTLFILIVSPILIFKFFKTKAGKKMLLETEIDTHVGSIQHIHVGDEGITIGRLAPVGKAKFGDQIVETKSITGYIDSNSRVKVIETTKTQIIVEPLN
ncbi:MAG: hypothetical protein ACK5MI_09250 [Mangrovibacterium sp.]